MSQRESFAELPMLIEAIGWDDDDVSDEIREREFDLLIECLYFLVAHEVGHVVLAHAGCNPFERDPVKLAESRDREGEADKFACLLLHRMGTTAFPTISTAYDGLGRAQTVTQHTHEAVGSGTVIDEVKYSYEGWGMLDLLEQDRNSAVGAGGSVDDYEVSQGQRHVAALIPCERFEPGEVAFDA